MRLDEEHDDIERQGAEHREDDGADRVVLESETDASRDSAREATMPPR
jgi:hypothetical protein